MQANNKIVFFQWKSYNFNSRDKIKRQNYKIIKKNLKKNINRY